MNRTEAGVGPEKERVVLSFWHTCTWGWLLLLFLSLTHTLPLRKTNVSFSNFIFQTDLCGFWFIPLTKLHYFKQDNTLWFITAYTSIWASTLWNLSDPNLKKNETCFLGETNILYYNHKLMSEREKTESVMWGCER